MRVLFIATVSAALAGAIATTGAEPLLAPSSGPSEVVGKAAAGEPKPYRSELLSDCDDASQCFLDFGKKQKARTISLVNCAAGVATGIVLLGEIRLDGPDAVVGYMAAVSRAPFSTGEYSVHEYPHRFVVAGGRRLTVVVSASGELNALRCMVDGTIE